MSLTVTLIIYSDRFTDIYICIYTIYKKHQVDRCYREFFRNEELNVDISEAINYRNVKTTRVKLSRDRSDAKDPPRKCCATTGLIFFILRLRQSASLTLFIIHRYFWELVWAGICASRCDTWALEKGSARDRRTFHLTYHLYYSTSYFLSFETMQYPRVQRERDRRQIGRDTYVDKRGPELRTRARNVSANTRRCCKMRKNVTRYMYVPPSGKTRVFSCFLS